MNSTTINFELPTFLIQQLGLDTQVINQEVKRMVALFLYEHQRISLSKACEIGGFTLDKPLYRTKLVKVVSI